MPALPKHEYIRISDDGKTIPLILEKDKFGKNVSPTAYCDLNKILNEEFSGAMAGHLRDTILGNEQEVILFPTQDDCTAFLLRYGHIYGKHA